MQGSWNQISAFLSNAVPWVDGCFVNIHAFQVEKSGKLTPRASRAAQDLQEATNFCQWADSKGWEVYCCMSAQRQPGTGKVDKRGRTIHRALRGETNAVCSRSFYVDVDVKEGAYGSSGEALEALRAVCAAIGLPDPSIVVWSGGGGYHAHWLLNVSVDPANWKPLAQKLASACRQHGLKADFGVTVDVARILRVPGTLNRKYDVGRIVTMDIVGTQTTLDTLMRVLNPYADIGTSPNFSSAGPGVTTRLATPLDPNIFPGKTIPLDPLVLEKFLGGTELEDPTLKEVAAECPLIKLALDTHGAGFPEPLWFETGKVAHFTKDGLVGFHRMSDGYAGYDPSETDDKYHYIVTSQISTDRGWPRCATIENAGSSVCGNCHNKVFNKSPLNFAKKIQLAPKVTPTSNPPLVNPPTLVPIDVDGYMQATNGIVLVTDKDGIEMPIWGYPIWNLKPTEDTGANKGSIQFDTIPDGSTSSRHVILPMDVFSDGRVLRAHLATNYRLLTNPKQTSMLVDFMTAFMQQLREKNKKFDIQENIGWSTDASGKLSAFTYGTTRYNCTGNTPFYQIDPIIKGIYTPRGTPDAWKAAVAMVNAEKRPAMDLLVATAFASPLMRFTGQSGLVIMACSSGSAFHKTTGLKVGQATWGSPKGINQLNDTENSVIDRLGKIKVLPGYYDEMKASTDVERFARTVFTMSGGRSKGRANRQGDARDTAEWDTLLVGASNDSLVSHLIDHDISTEAGINRVYEIEVDRPNPGVGQIDMGKAAQIISDLRTNFGHAGEAYAEILGKNVDHWQTLVSDQISDYANQFGAKQDERFWIAGMATLRIGALTANNIGLTNFNVDRMEQFMAQQLDRLRVIRGRAEMDLSKGPSMASIIGYFINSQPHSVLVTDVIQRAPGRLGHTTGVQIINGNDLRYNNGIVAHIAQVDQIVRISKKQFVVWCAKNKLTGTTTVSNIMQQLGGKVVFSRLGTGTHINANAKEYLIELDCRHPDLANLI